MPTSMGKWSWLSRAQVLKARLISLRLLIQLMRCARDLARANAGSNMAARMAMMAITTSSSIRVKAAVRSGRTLGLTTGLLPRLLDEVCGDLGLDSWFIRPCIASRLIRAVQLIRREYVSP